MNIIVKINLGEEETVAFKDLFQSTIATYKEAFSFDLSRLESVIFASDFKEELQLLSERIKKPVLYTNNTQAVAIVKCMTIIEDNKPIDILIFSEHYTNLLFSDAKSAMNILLHELSHIYENTIIDKKSPPNLNKQLSEYEYTFVPVAKSVVSEFYANYVSSATLTQFNLESTIDSLIGYLLALDDKIIKTRELYRNNRMDLDTFLYDYFFVYSRGLYVSFAYALGYCHGLSKKLNEISPKAYNLIKEHGLASIYNELYEIFLKKLDGYPNSWNTQLYKPIYENIHQYYKKLGISAEERDIQGVMRLYVNVFEP